MLATDIARLMAQIPKEEAMQIAAAAQNGEAGRGQTPVQQVRGGAFDMTVESETPFGFGRGEGLDKGSDESEWVVGKDRFKADEEFDHMGPIDGKLSGRSAKEFMVKSKLPNTVLSKIWKLADVDKDGMLDADEFALAKYLIDLKLEGHEMPAELPKHLIPPSKRDVAVYAGATKIPPTPPAHRHERIYEQIETPTKTTVKNGTTCSHSFLVSHSDSMKCPHCV